MELIQIVQNDIVAFLTERNDELFFNERDFQMHLAIWLKASSHAYDDVDVEYYVPYETLDNYIWKNELRLDIVVKKNSEYLPVELKYKTKSVSKKLPRFDEKLGASKGGGSLQIMKNQGAQNLGMYDFWKDVRRIELVRNRFKRVKGGLAVFLTNDDAYLKEPKSTSNNYLFSMKEGVHGKQKHWQKSDSVSAKTHPDFTLEKEYEIKWNSTNAEGVELNYCIVAV